MREFDLEVAKMGDHIYAYMIEGKSNRVYGKCNGFTYRIESLGKVKSGNWTILRIHKTCITDTVDIFINTLFNLPLVMRDVQNRLSGYIWDGKTEYWRYDARKLYIDIRVRFK